MHALLVVVHIILFAVALAFTDGASIVVWRCLRSGDYPTTAVVARAAEPLARIGGACWALTGLTGLLLTIEAGYSFADGWIVASLALFGALFANGLAVHARWGAAVLRELERTGPLRPEALTALAAAPTKKVGWAVTAAAIAALIFLMEAKPALL